MYGPRILEQRSRLCQQYLHFKMCIFIYLPKYITGKTQNMINSEIELYPNPDCKTT